ncbi:hypothetical protein P4J17_26515 [Bacillus cereus]|uniref:hypothetical protein n=1 Tax=Bacillus thuringiensis TaxID=1428 RepID=UPI0018CCD60C|nr:hypothetical protein [Bacillus thuringiensis]MEB9339364.1 hypothetical protein [Bacillus cereus]
MLKKQEILAVYQKGPHAICDLVHHLENQIQDLKGRIEELENRSKKTKTICLTSDSPGDRNRNGSLENQDFIREFLDLI